VGPHGTIFSHRHSPIIRITLPTCRAPLPRRNRDRCSCRLPPPCPIRPSPYLRRVGIPNPNFCEACSGFTLHSRYGPLDFQPSKAAALCRKGFSGTSYPAEPLASYQIKPTTIWLEPSSTADPRRRGAGKCGLMHFQYKRINRDKRIN
jgi:hypothetical protein